MPISVVKVYQQKFLSEALIKILQEVSPEIVLAMMRLRFTIHGISERDIHAWVNANCTGFVHCYNAGQIWFESDEDATLFVTRFSASVVDHA